MLICPRCEKRMGRDHHCSLLTRRHFFFGLLAGAAVALMPSAPSIAETQRFWLAPPAMEVVDISGMETRAISIVVKFQFDCEKNLWAIES